MVSCCTDKTVIKLCKLLTNTLNTEVTIPDPLAERVVLRR